MLSVYLPQKLPVPHFQFLTSSSTKQFTDVLENNKLSISLNYMASYIPKLTITVIYI